MSGWTRLFNIFLIILYLITGFFITKSSVYLNPYTNDVNIATAHKYATWSSVLVWFLLAFTIIGIVLYFVYYAEGGAELQLVQSQASSGWGATLFFIIMLILLTITGILSAAAAHYIQISSPYTGGNKDVAIAYTDAVVAACLCIGIVLLVLVAIAVIYHQNNKPKEVELQNMV